MLVRHPPLKTPFTKGGTGGFGLPINNDGAIYLVLSIGSGDYEGRIDPPDQ